MDIPVRRDSMDRAAAERDSERVPQAVMLKHRPCRLQTACYFCLLVPLFSSKIFTIVSERSEHDGGR